jgi:SWI/SNF chromatin-remodeling complex subunit SWI1
MIKNYIPYRASADTQAGHDIVTLSSLGQDIDMAKPVFLFAPELGAINLHALTMSLKAMTSPYSDEVTNALNTLLVVSLDAALSIKLPECPELLDALCTVGSNLVDCIVRQSPKMAPCKVATEPAGAIDAVFERYVKPDSQDEDIAFFVDSLTGQVVQDSDMDLDDDLFSEANPSTAELLPDTLDRETREFHLDDYMSGLRGFKDENRHHFSKQQTRSATNDQIMMVDQLVSVLMILRSLSVSDVNKPIATTNVLFKNLIMQTVMAVGEHGDKFVFHRKRLSLLKDCLLMLQNVALEIHLSSMEEAFTALALVFSFGPAPSSDLDIPEAPLDTYTYLPFAVDVLTKLLVQEPQNRSLMQAVLTGTLAAPTGVSRQDHERTKALATMYLGDEHKLRQGQLITHAFRLLMSVIPYEKSAPELTKVIFSSAPTMSQALFGVKLVLDLVPMEDDSGLSDLSSRWLIANKFRILSNLGRSAVAMIGEAAKLQRGSSEHRIVTSIVQQVLLVVNTLLAHALATRDKLLQTNKESTLIGEIDDLVNIVRVAPDPLFAMETVLATLVDGALSREVVRLLAVLGKLEKR